jgi:hypothetical protein
MKGIVKATYPSEQVNKGNRFLLLSFLLSHDQIVTLPV